MSEITVDIATKNSEPSSPKSPIPSAASARNAQTTCMHFPTWISKSGSACKKLGESIYLVLGYVYVYIIFPTGDFIFSRIAKIVSGIDNTERYSNKLKPSKNISERTEKLNDIVKEKVTKALRFVRNRLGLLVLLWLILNLTIPRVRSEYFLLGSELWKWAVLAAMISCGYIVIDQATESLLRLFDEWFEDTKFTRYFMHGLRKSVSWIIYSWSILLTWVFYFRASYGIKSPGTEVAIHIGTWTFTTLSIASVLLLLKDTLLLIWKADVVYNRFKDRIFISGFQLYYLAYIIEFQWDREDMKKYFRPHIEEAKKDKVHDGEDAQNTVAPSTDTNNKLVELSTMDIDKMNKEKEHEQQKRRSDKDNLCNERKKLYKGSSTYHIKKMVEYFKDLSKKVEFREDVEASRALVDKCILLATSHKDDNITVKNLNAVSKIGLEEAYAELLISDLAKEHMLGDSKKIPIDKFKKSMVMAHKNCVALGHTLIDAFEVVKVLNKVMNGVIILISLIVWLLLTNLATSKIFVLVASPFLAATFVFGDTFKRTFEGVVFSFINHPFNVGDLCIIDGVELEVKCMGVWKTTFILIARKGEEAFYPNSILATKPIINLRGETDHTDRVELKLAIGCNANLAALQEKITEFVKNDESREFKALTIEEVGSYIRMTVEFNLVMGTMEVTHSECFKKKREQRSKFLVQIVHYLDDSNIKLIAASPST